MRCLSLYGAVLGEGFLQQVNGAISMESTRAFPNSNHYIASNGTPGDNIVGQNAFEANNIESTAVFPNVNHHSSLSGAEGEF